MAKQGFCIPGFQTTNILGFDSIISFDRTDINESLALYFAGIMLLAQTLYHLFAGPGGLGKISTFRALVVNYNLSVALFATIRALMDTGRPLILGAAFHNAMEWGIVSHILSKRGDVQKHVTLAMGWVWMIQCISLYIDFLPAVLLIQITGITVDFILCLTFYRLYQEEKRTEMQPIWMAGLLGSLTHFGQIFSLVIANAVAHNSTSARLMEFVLVFSSGVTFFFYGQMAFMWETLEQLKGTTLKTWAEHEMEKVDGKTVKATETLPFHAKTVPWWKEVFATAMILAVGTIAAPIIFACPPEVAKGVQAANVYPSFQVDHTGMAGFTVFVPKPGFERAMETELKRLLRPVRAEPGCVSYNMFKKSNPPSFLFEEKWASLDALKKHMGSENVARILHNDYFKSLMQDEQVNGPWLQIEPLDQPLKSWSPCPDPTGKDKTCLHDDEVVNGWHMTVDKPIGELWSKLGNIKDCTWVMGTHSTWIKPEGNGRIMYFGKPENYSMWVDEDIEFDEKSHTIVYKILDTSRGLPHIPGSYEATIKMSPNGDKTDFSYVTRYIPKPEFGGDKAMEYVKKDMEERFSEIKALKWLNFPATVLLEKKP